MKNRKYLIGFASGLLCCLLVLGIAFQVLGANRNITINDSIKVEFNGQAFTPRDANGKTVPVFTYDGTTYAPIRALCEAAGMQVDYDAATRTAKVTASVLPTATPPSTVPDSITKERAKEIALEHAGLQASQVTFFRVELDAREREYEVEFYCGNIEYDYEIHALSGEILSFDYDVEDYDIPSSSQGGSSDDITKERAKQIALNHAGVKEADATFVRVKLDYEDGRRVYEVEFYSGSTEYDYEIDAATGKILGWDHDVDDFHIPSTQQPGWMISEEEARQIALDHAGLKASQVSFFRVELDVPDYEYEVEFYSGNIEYDYEIDAYTGAILSWDHDVEDFTVPPTPQPTSGSVQLLSQGRAKEIALSHAPAKSRVVKCELDYDDGKAIYELELLSGYTEIECELDALTGAVLKWEIDD